MKIAVVAPTYLPALRANTIQVMKMTQAFVEQGHAARLAVPCAKPSEISHRWDKLAQHYGLAHEFPVDWLPVNKSLRGYDFGWQALRWARRWGADLVYTRHPQTAAFASLRGIPVILEVHDVPQGNMGRQLFQAFLRGRGARRLVIITYALAQELAKRFPALAEMMPVRPAYYVVKSTSHLASDFVLIAPDGVDLVRYVGLPAPESARMVLLAQADFPFPTLEVERFTAGYTGHLYPGRGTDLLLNLAERLPQVNFLLVGGEVDAVERLRYQVQQRCLENVIITGFVPNADLPLYQAACDVLLMPYQERVAASSGGDISRYLSPMKAFEYLACGRPIVVSNLPVFREIFSPKNALLVGHNDLEAWVDALCTLQAEPQRCEQLGEQARADVQRYDWTQRAGYILAGMR